MGFESMESSSLVSQDQYSQFDTAIRAARLASRGALPGRLQSAPSADVAQGKKQDSLPMDDEPWLRSIVATPSPVAPIPAIFLQFPAAISACIDWCLSVRQRKQRQRRSGGSLPLNLVGWRRSAQEEHRPMRRYLRGGAKGSSAGCSCRITNTVLSQSRTMLSK
jgi:hypothetical protein